MNKGHSRRGFLRSTAVTSGLFGAEVFGFLRLLPPVTAADAKVDPKLVQLTSDIEPMVRLLETTPREDLIEVVVGKIRKGTSYREVLAALMLAGVRNVQPRPAVGFKFHSVLVVNAAHLASLSAPDADRWLPILWAIDYFKATQLEEEKASGWKLAPVQEGRVPSATKARAALISALDKWDAEAADAAIAGFVRTAGSQEIIELLYRYGARDYRSIGHKAIYVANSWRTLQCIGWQYAEPIMRSLVYAILNHEGDPNPATADLAADRAWKANRERAHRIRVDWQEGKLDPAATREMMSALRTGTADDVAELGVTMLNRGVAAQSLWDAALVGSGEILMRQPGIVGLHTLTASNALHYAYAASQDDDTRRMMLLQNLSFLTLFRKSAEDRGALKKATVEQLVAAESAASDNLTDVFRDISADRDRASAKLRGYLSQGGDANAFVDAARRMVFLKGNDAHDYKFSAAVLEDFGHVSPEFRNLFLSLSVYNLPGAAAPDTRLRERVRKAFA